MKISLVGLIIISFMCALLPECLAQNYPEDYLKILNAARAEVGWDSQLESYAYAHLSKHIGDCMHADSIKKHYDEKSNSCVGGFCFCYIQSVWHHTTYVGCARVKCNNGFHMVSCNYNPPALKFPGERTLLIN
ncbi:hypothetical protein Ahy_A10g050921 [Arachis hypogaea]|uniref:SCP domain-containing protein n=1 Tax=Arachis hypogaea TaxID=3818 RepID=A0A445BAW7_ARAHY|nr:hypothetical protein Ahy_A10g050921 [Arachis hypogaea]